MINLIKVTFVLPCYPSVPMGGFSVVYEYANKLSKRGYDVSLIHSRYISNNQKSKEFNGRFIRKLSIIKGMIFKPEIKWHSIDGRVNISYVEEITSPNIPDADFVFATSWETAEYTIGYPRVKGEKLYLIQDFEEFTGTKDKIEKTWKFPIKKIFIAKWLYNKGLELGLSPSFMKYVPNGIDHEKYTLYNNIKNRKNQIAMLYHSSPHKGSIYGIKALKIVKKEFPSVKAVLFGVESRPSSLPNWINYVKNPPQDKLVKEIYNQSSIFICPSLYEGWGLPGAEALSCGCALVSTDTGGVNDYAKHKQNALLSSPKDSKKMAENVLLLLKNNKLRISLANDGYNSIQKFNWDNSTDLLEEFMKAIV